MLHSTHNKEFTINFICCHHEGAKKKAFFWLHADHAKVLPSLGVEFACLHINNHPRNTWHNTNIACIRRNLSQSADREVNSNASNTGSAAVPDIKLTPIWSRNAVAVVENIDLLPAELGALLLEDIHIDGNNII